MEIKLESTYKGTRILLGDSANNKRDYINNMISILRNKDYNEIMLPIIQKQDTFKNKVGGENMKMMYTFKDQGERDLCLAPEYTAIIQQLAKERFKFEKNIKLFYVQECFRGENVQAGRYRQFTQLGVEIINPTEEYYYDLIDLASELIKMKTFKFEVNSEAVRGLDYYKEGKGFEIACTELGAQKQVCGGGEYEGGIGFAIGVDRLLLCK